MVTHAKAAWQCHLCYYNQQDLPVMIVRISHAAVPGYSDIG